MMRPRGPLPARVRQSTPNLAARQRARGLEKIFLFPSSFFLVSISSAAKRCASSAPTGAFSPSRTRIAPITPDAGASTSTMTLSVSTSMRGAPCATRSPSRASQRTTVPSSIVSPSLGMMMSVGIDLCHLSQ